MSDEFPVGSGVHGTVGLDQESGLVVKRLQIDDRERAAKLAMREFEYLVRFTARLASKPYLDCPAPITVQPEKSAIWMTYCPGTRLDAFLASNPKQMASHLEHIAAQIVDAVHEYVSEFQEPWFSIGSQNMIYQEDTGRLYLFDFTSPRIYPGIDPLVYPYEITLGNFVGASTYQTVRPSTFMNRRYWTNQRVLFLAVAQRINAEPELWFSIAERVSAVAYRNITSQARSSRWMWYTTIGHLLFFRRSREVFRAQGRAPS